MRTPLFVAHVESGAKIVDFAGYEMPLHYGSQVAEHHAVRQGVGFFDVSHMGVLDLVGDDASKLLEYTLVGDVLRLDQIGKSFYTALLNDDAGIIDDVIVYRTSKGYRMVANAGSKQNVTEHLEAQIEQLELDQCDVRMQSDQCIIAIQGPHSIDLASKLLNTQRLVNLGRFHSIEVDDYQVARTGYTGEDGIEWIGPADVASRLWESLTDHAQPCGLAARDTLRLEAGLNLYGHDMDTTTHPDESNLRWIVHLKNESREFVGRRKLEEKRAQGVPNKLTGLIVEGRGVIRDGYEVETDVGSGKVTSGLFAPSLGYSIGLARIPKKAMGRCRVKVRNRELTCRLVKPPFIRDGEPIHT